MLFNTLVLSTLALFLSTVDAHPSIAPKYVEPNQSLNASFYIPHGCDGSSTVEVTVMVPEIVKIITPESFDNWTALSTHKDETSEEITEFTWSGSILADGDKLYFPFNITIPSVDLSSAPNMTLYFPTYQKCEVGWSNWTSTDDHSDHDATAHGTMKPAPFMVVVKNAADANAATADETSKGTNDTAEAAATHLIMNMLPIIATITTLGFML